MIGDRGGGGPGITRGKEERESLKSVGGEGLLMWQGSAVEGPVVEASVRCLGEQCLYKDLRWITAVVL